MSPHDYSLRELWEMYRGMREMTWPFVPVGSSKNGKTKPGEHKYPLRKDTMGLLKGVFFGAN